MIEQVHGQASSALRFKRPVGVRQQVHGQASLSEGGSTSPWLNKSMVKQVRPKMAQQVRTDLTPTHALLQGASLSKWVHLNRAVTVLAEQALSKLERVVS